MPKRLVASFELSATKNDRHDPAIIKRRIEAAVMGAQINARNHGGDNAIALMDLLCALVLISVKSGVPIDMILTPSQLDHAKAVVADFWPAGQVN